MREVSEIVALGTSADETWLYYRDVERDVWATTRQHVGQTFIAGLARGRLEVLSGRFPLMTADCRPLGWSVARWREALLQEAWAAGPIPEHQLPAVRFVAAPIIAGELLELPPMRGYPAPRLARRDRGVTDLMPNERDDAV